MNDFDACLAMDRDPDVTRHILGPWNDPVLHERFLRERIAQSLGLGLGYWSIFPKERPTEFAGWVLMIPCDGVGPEIEIGWRLTRSSWGKGYATEAARPVVTHAFETVGVRQLVADIDPQNVGSMRVAEKIGMRFIGDGRHLGVPCKSYRMTMDDYHRGPSPRFSVVEASA